MPAGWTDEQFKVVDGGDGTVALWSPIYKRFVRMPDGDKLDKSGVRNDGTLPAGWDQERFEAVCLSGCNDDWKYTYKCAKISDSSLPRKEVTTGCNVAADHKIEYLVRQNVNCPKNY